MIKPFIDKFMAAEPSIREKLAAEHPGSYEAIVKLVVDAINPGGEEYGWPHPDRIHSIDDGDYQGTLLFVIAAEGYQPSEYWYVKVGYGSCSGCDTLQAINDYSDTPSEDQVGEYWSLALHVAQGLSPMQDDSFYVS